MVLERLTVTLINLEIRDDLLRTYRWSSHLTCQSMVKLFTLYKKEGLIDGTTLSILTGPILDAYKENRKQDIAKIDEEIEELVDSLGELVEWKKEQE